MAADTPTGAATAPGALDLDAIEARTNQLSPGRWCALTCGDETIIEDGAGQVIAALTCAEYNKAHGPFIAASRTDVPVLVAEVRRLRAERESPTVADEAVLRLHEELARRTAERDDAVAMNTTQAETISNLLSYVADRVGPSATWGDYGQWLAAKDAIDAARATPSEEVARG